MKIFNVSGKKIIFIIALILLLIVLLFSAISIINDSTIVMTNENYTNILKECHDDPYKYLDKKIITTGYIFRANDFTDTQFVTARDMLINQAESRIVGFLCEYKDIKNFENNEWVSVEGTLTVGDYYGAMPIIKVKHIAKITTPDEVFVNPPN